MTQEALEQKVTDIQIALTKVEQREKSNTLRLNEVEEKVSETVTLVTAIKELAIETKYMREDLNGTINRLDKLEASNIDNTNDELRRKNEELQKQADKWEKFKWLIVAGLVTVIIGFLATSLNLK